MCGRKKRDPRIDEEQKKAREAAEAAKQQALAEQEAQRQKQLEAEREAAATAAAAAEAEAGKAARQAELEQGVIQEGELTNTGTSKAPKKSAAAMRRGRSGRSGRRGRRSLLTSSGGGIGYYSRFL